MVIKWNDNNTISVDVPKKLKKITGTRFASILGKNAWNTPFKTWCEITKTYEEPFEDSKYTIAGKTIEPIQHEYMRKMYGMSNLVSPEDVYGEDFFNKTYGDFYPDEKIFGGMWDALLTNEENQVEAVLEFKTTSRPEDWEKDVPEYYSLQGALYAYLLNTQRVIMVCSFLKEEDYKHPEKFKPTVLNTIVREFDIYEKFPEFDNYIKEAKEFWNNNVKKGVSPEFTDRDKEIIKSLRTTTLSDTNEIEELLKEAEELKSQIEKNAEKMATIEKKYKEIADLIKNKLVSQLDSDTDTISVEGSSYKWEVKKSFRNEINKELLKTDGLLEKYLETKETYTLRVKEKEGNEI